LAVICAALSQNVFAYYYMDDGILGLVYLPLHEPVHLARIRLAPRFLHDQANDEVQSPLASRPVVGHGRGALRHCLANSLLHSQLGSNEQPLYA